jgi:hypothetical protein
MPLRVGLDWSAMRAKYDAGECLTLAFAADPVPILPHSGWVSEGYVGEQRRAIMHGE